MCYLKLFMCYLNNIPNLGATKYFQREFPTLGGDAEKDITAENHAEKTEQDASHLVMAHPQAFISKELYTFTSIANDEVFLLNRFFLQLYNFDMCIVYS